MSYVITVLTFSLDVIATDILTVDFPMFFLILDFPILIWLR